MFKSLCAALLLVASVVYAKPYPNLDLGSLVKAEEGSHQVDIGKAIYFSEVIGEFAGEYPPKFDNEMDKERAIQDMYVLAQLLTFLVNEKMITQESPEYIPVTHTVARLGWMGHNLKQDVAEISNRLYPHLIEIVDEKERPAMQTEYGRFLFSSAQIEKSVEVLQQAFDAGYAPAEKWLAISLLSSGKKEQALKHLRHYQKSAPNDKQASELLAAIEAGKVEFIQE